MIDCKTGEQITNLVGGNELSTNLPFAYYLQYRWLLIVALQKTSAQIHRAILYIYVLIRTYICWRHIIYIMFIFYMTFICIEILIQKFNKYSDRYDNLNIIFFFGMLFVITFWLPPGFFYIPRSKIMNTLTLT